MRMSSRIVLVSLLIPALGCRPRTTGTDASKSLEEAGQTGGSDCTYDDYSQPLAGSLNAAFGFTKLKADISSTLTFTATTASTTADISNVKIFPSLALLRAIVNKLIQQRNRPADIKLLTGEARKSLPDWRNAPCSLVGITTYTSHDPGGDPANDTVIEFKPAIPFFVWHAIKDGEMTGDFSGTFPNITATVVASTSSTNPLGSTTTGTVTVSQPDSDRHQVRVDFDFQPESKRRAVGLGTWTVWQLNDDRSAYASLTLVDTNEFDGKEIPLTLNAVQ